MNSIIDQRRDDDTFKHVYQQIGRNSIIYNDVFIKFKSSKYPHIHNNLLVDTKIVNDNTIAIHGARRGRII